MNNLVLVGRLTKDPQLKIGNNNLAVAVFTLAVDRGVKDARGEKQTDFIQCKAFGKQAENLCRYQSKGNLIGLCGSIHTGSYQAKDGTTKYTTDVIASSISYLQAKREESKEDKDNMDWLFNQADQKTENQKFNFGSYGIGINGNTIFDKNPFKEKE
ncbi:single-stranded DNA-binding protein [Gemella sp. zg-570]|uniref:single-stranded DNA-binding protein n=1 Tax=Gemella sp. zg-570 TaxID=2840371 RepID=UPI001C0CD548|nr:single-stranded DNA-binding protein [Gemella sp. zg-570]QWQ39270.1 single-stranded DNA-binding protein [Gemella sp. zg-570]